MLSNELAKIMDLGQGSLACDAIDNDVHRWRVRLSGFEGPLAQDMARVKARHGYDFVELKVTFTPDLHPFYPPHVELVRPRFSGWLLGSIMSHPLFELAGWDPMKPMTELIGLVRGLVQDHGRVDTESDLNDSSRPSSYSQLEVVLNRLELLTGTRPRAAERFPELYADRDSAVDTGRAKLFRNLAQTNHKPPQEAAAGRASEDTKARKAYWASGTGYGHGSSRSSETWDAKAAVAAQSYQDAQLLDVLRQVQQYLGTADDEVQRQFVHDSSLQPYLARELRQASLMDMSTRHKYYLAVVVLLETCVGADWLEPIMAQPVELLSTVASEARIFVSSMQASDKAAPASTKNARGGSAKKQSEDQQLDELSAALELAATVVRVDEAAVRRTCTGGASGAAAARAGVAVGSEGAYVEELQPLRFEMVTDMASRTKYKQEVASTNGADRARMGRLAKEVASMGRNLPCALSSSTFVRVDEARLDLWQAMITGPEDTPYEGGCFVFDIFFPQRYPNCAPLVNLQTTGGGTVRFNPNLYNCGKVCLSLLGTWEGARGEQWDASSSTMLQVLISVASLILVPAPYFNEPGFEATMGTPEGDEESSKYNSNIREQTIRFGMLDQLRNPKPGFEEATDKHFALRKLQLLKTARRWASEAAQRSPIRALVAQLEQELEKL